MPSPRVPILAPVALVAALLVAACGETTVVHEKPLTVSGAVTPSPSADARAPESRAVRIAMVTHGEASSPFWAIVRNGRLAFAIDQQAYLQGYLPVIMLAERARYGLFPARHRGAIVPTGPKFVTRATASRVIELSKRSIR